MATKFFLKNCQSIIPRLISIVKGVTIVDSRRSTDYRNLECILVNISLKVLVIMKLGMVIYIIFSCQMSLWQC